MEAAKKFQNKQECIQLDVLLLLDDTASEDGLGSTGNSPQSAPVRVFFVGSQLEALFAFWRTSVLASSVAEACNNAPSCAQNNFSISVLFSCERAVANLHCRR